MNVFVLCTGRCGSTTFIMACQEVRNYTAGHETRAHLIGRDRFSYPENHIEADNRLSWMLGRLHRAYGDRARYVHLTRDPETTAQSFARRFDRGIMLAYRDGIVMGRRRDVDPLPMCRDYVETVTANIERFLRDKSQVCRVRLEHLAEDFRRFWEAIGAIGSLSRALVRCRMRFNASPSW